MNFGGLGILNVAVTDGGFTNESRATSAKRRRRRHRPSRDEMMMMNDVGGGKETRRRWRGRKKVSYSNYVNN